MSIIAIETGDMQPDGTVYVDISPSTHKPLFVTASGADKAMTTEESVEYIKQLNNKNAYGHNDWRLADKQEMNAIFKCRYKGVLKDTFNEPSSGDGTFGMAITKDQIKHAERNKSERENDPRYRYLTSELLPDGSVSVQSFIDGAQRALSKKDALVSVRPVRG